MAFIIYLFVGDETSLSDNLPETDPLVRLQKENFDLRLKFEALEKIVSEVTPELEGLTLEARIKALKTKTLNLSKDKLRLSILVSYIRKLLVSSTISGETEHNLDQAKKLLDEEIYKK